MNWINRFQYFMSIHKLAGLVIFMMVSMMSYSQEEAIEKVLLTFFDGMREGDSSMITSILGEEVILVTSFEKDGKIQLKKGSMEEFLTAVGTPHEEVWDERIWDVNIQLDDRLASAWMKYAFYLGDEFSHCGVNHFLLTEQKEGWKIIHIADTRRKSPCTPPD